MPPAANCSWPWPPRGSWVQRCAWSRCLAANDLIGNPRNIDSRSCQTECTRRVAIEAGVPDLWYKYVGIQGRVIGINRFGLSAPGPLAMKELGISLDHLLEVVPQL